MTDISKVNFKKPYGTVVGDPNIRYIQDGHSYRHDGTLFAEKDTEPPVPPEGSATQPPVIEEPKPEDELSASALEALEEQRNRSRSEAMLRYWEDKRAQAKGIK